MEKESARKVDFSAWKADFSACKVTLSVPYFLSGIGLRLLRKPYPTDHRHIKGIPHAILRQMLQSSFLHEKIIKPSPPPFPLPPRPSPVPFIILLTCSLRLKSQKGFTYIISVVIFKSYVMQQSFMQTKVD
jgi:hypothetical protein